MKLCGAVSMLPEMETSLAMCSMENDLGIMRVVSLMNTSALSPLNAQQ